MKLKINNRLKYPRLIVKDDGQVILEVNRKDKNNKKLHKEVLHDNEMWLEKKIEEKNKDRPHPIDKTYEYVDGMALYIMGKAYKLKLLRRVEGNNQSANVFYGDKNYIVVYCKKKDSVRELLRNFIINECSPYIKGKLESYRIQLGLQEINFALKEYKNKLGLCKKSGELFFDWRILMLDSRLIDYIILHELVHLQEMSHKQSFWNRLKMIMPDYGLREKEIKVQRAILFNF